MVGIPSWYAGCAIPGYPAVYTRMTAFEDWLTPIYEDRDPKRSKCNYRVHKDVLNYNTYFLDVFAISISSI